MVCLQSINYIKILYRFLCTLIIPLFSPAIIPCPVTADIAFIVDSSDSIGVINYMKTKYFVYSIANAFNVSSSGAHAGVVIYSEIAKRPIKFTDHTNIESFKEAVYNLEYMKLVRYYFNVVHGFFIV